MDTNLEKLLESILLELKEVNNKLDNISGYGVYGISDVCNKIMDASTEVSDSIDLLRGNGEYDSLVDVCNKLDNLG